jgi:hypothetical protein
MRYEIISFRLEHRENLQTKWCLPTKLSHEEIIKANKERWGKLEQRIGKCKQIEWFTDSFNQHHHVDVGSKC